MVIRKPVPGEATEIEAIWEQSVRATHHFLSEKDLEDIRTDVRKALSSLETFVAEEGGTAVGFMLMHGSMIEALFIDPAAMGRGIGTLFVEYAKKRFPGQELRVDVNEDNAAAAAFYQARGFRRIGRSETDGAGRPFPILHLTLDPVGRTRERKA